ncbi:YXWGXW repeat-containing protein [Edaphobacter albus]|uniref:YXWGXW repeat-containing protein n=1 Tax=Edaphobacter sp. 4G125 TaxID=2763071 RepID=UPI0016440428|nr:YXWGXW repeat-containing protein [Edaphobacter sp. 4G125]QNI36900.1 YXWGXW repeat-containing protein [Edaphobacter sp. 4G125]
MLSLKKVRTILLATAVAISLPTAAMASVNIGIGISVNTPPPVLPVYTQPMCPGAGYIWTPGYWAWGPEGYYWVPGVWVMAPAPGMLWTPGYWGWSGGAYIFHAGYWGPHIGFYGGVNYGFGYTGVGYHGGYWNGNNFYYNRTVNNINVTKVTNVYNKTVIVNNVNNHVSYNGGKGGLQARPNAQEQTAFNERRFQPTSNQVSHEQAMRNDRGQLASANHGRPQTMAMSRVGERGNMQQQRVANGVRSGQLTPHETSNIERNETHINQQVRADRQANGGHLTQPERQQVNREQNRASQQINRDTHNNERERR